MSRRAQQTLVKEQEWSSLGVSESGLGELEPVAPFIVEHQY